MIAPIRLLPAIGRKALLALLLWSGSLGVAASAGPAVAAAASTLVPAPDGSAAPAVEADGFRVDRIRLDVNGGTASGSAALHSARQATVASDVRLVIVHPDQPATIDFRVRTGGAWGPWLSLEPDSEDAPDGVRGGEGRQSAPGAAAVGPVWIGEGVDRVEVRADTAVELELLAPTGGLLTPPAGSSPGPLGGSGGGDGPVGGLVANLSRSQPTVQPRSSWATGGWATQNGGCGSGPSYSTNIRAAIIHHTVTANSYAQSDVPAILRAIYRLHVGSRGWCDIAYNFVVDRFGTIWEARGGGVDRPVIGGHTKGFNTWTVGVALLGQHQQGLSPVAVSPTAATSAAVENLLSWKLGLYGVDPSGTTWLLNRSDTPSGDVAPGAWVHTPTITYHRALGETSCPGNLTLGFLPGWRAALTAERVGEPPYAAPARTPYEHGPGFVTLDEVGGTRASGAAGQPVTGLVPAGRRAVAIGGNGGSGLVLLDDGRLVGYGAASDVAPPAGARAVADVVVRSDGISGWVLAADGGLHSFRGAPPATVNGFAGVARAAVLNDAGVGYVLSDRGLYPVNGALAVSATAFDGPAAVDIALRPDGQSGWVVERNGRLAPFGGAPAWKPLHPVGELVAGFASRSGHGGWVIDREGRVVPFGEERPIVPINSTVGVPTVVDGDLTAFVVDDSSAMIRFARSLTSLFLGQPIGGAEADWLAARVTYGGRATVVAELAHSDAWAGRVVDELYRDVLGRPADAAGRAYWVKRLATGLRTQDLGAHFYASPEYVRQSGDHEAYVRRLYGALLQRPPDDQGLAYWVKRLESGDPPGSITAGFYQSVESRRSRVTGLYDAILGRRPDGAGLEFWSDQLLRRDDIALAVELASSAEYWRRATEES